MYRTLLFDKVFHQNDTLPETVKPKVDSDRLRHSYTSAVAHVCRIFSGAPFSRIDPHADVFLFFPTQMM